MLELLLHWIVAAVAVMITSYILPGVTIEGAPAAFVTAVILGVINITLKPMLFVLTLPINLVTLGLFTLIINAGLIMLTSIIVPGFTVTNFWWALLFGIVLFLVNSVLYSVNRRFARD
jgi:putative membrane protein